MDKVRDEIKEYLETYCTDESNAISAGELATLFNTTKRWLRLIVQDLRANRVPVCSGNSGYWYSYNEEDIEKTVRRLEAQADNLERACRGLRFAQRGELHG